MTSENQYKKAVSKTNVSNVSKTASSDIEVIRKDNLDLKHWYILKEFSDRQIYK